MKIGPHHLSPKAPVFCIAEVGINHNGDLAIAKELINIAKKCGAHAVKFQTYVTEDLVAKETPMATYQQENTGGKNSQYEMLKAFELSFKAHEELKRFADKTGLLFLSTPHSGLVSVDLLEQLGVTAYKVASPDLTHYPLLRYIAQKQKPLLLSTGMSSWEEVFQAVSWIRKTSFNDLVLLQCTSDYPCAWDDVNLKTMAMMHEKLKVLVGLSDHTLGWEASVLATRLGAVCIERHITLDRGLSGPDHAASLEPKAFGDCVLRVQAERQGDHVSKEIPDEVKKRLLGKEGKTPTNREKETAALVRKSIIAKNDLKKGSIIEFLDLDYRRPGTGLSPAEFERVIGKTLTANVAKGTPLSWSDFS